MAGVFIELKGIVTTIVENVPKGIMKIPKQIMVCGHKINIKYKKNIIEEGSDCWGTWDNDRHEITLRYGMNPSQRAEVLLHEVLHAISDIHLLNLTEKAVKILGIEILATVRNNRLNLLEKKHG